ncbi:MAG: glycosyltransferase family 2 protein [Streptococcaceae bacterium]|jgi:glycosyltransferase involved in cell wall biosynthesis|nr:glycosyltransferase family 2 protein [Streptococcaceae bacterium]
MISIVIPCYNESESVPYFYKEMEKIRQTMSYEFEYIFVDDHSTDTTREVLRELQAGDPAVHFIFFSKNFGKEAGMLAGLREASGDFVTVMDADLQDPPTLIPKMMDILEEGVYDCVGTRRSDRSGEDGIRSFFSALFYKLENKISDTKMVDGARDFRMMTRQVLDSVLSLTEYNRFSKGLFEWVGYDTYYLEYENVEREHGNTSWSFWNLLSYSIEGVINFSAFPLRIASFFGFFTFVIAILASAFIVINTLYNGIETPGWASMTCILLFLGGIQLFAIGVLGEYISKIFLETKNRPHYIIKEKK